MGPGNQAETSVEEDLWTGPEHPNIRTRFTKKMRNQGWGSGWELDPQTTDHVQVRSWLWGGLISTLSLQGFDGIWLWFLEELSGCLGLVGCEGEAAILEHPGSRHANWPLKVGVWVMNRLRGAAVWTAVEEEEEGEGKKEGDKGVHVG
ncbi:hypothetical protein DPX16_12849 [Anabarilius grahami]|uniref:Uncharacterized protein n=1 Tax=Anabarilius grahami TaxID=495550 RepID=A0A3N0XD25_ANAGA|nr:hypothetical protein DPX16_12849 [Anabarilius grahami]